MCSIGPSLLTATAREYLLNRNNNNNNSNNNSNSNIDRGEVRHIIPGEKKNTATHGQGTSTGIGIGIGTNIDDNDIRMTSRDFKDYGGKFKVRLLCYTPFIGSQ